MYIGESFIFIIRHIVPEEMALHHYEMVFEQWDLHFVVSGNNYNYKRLETDDLTYIIHRFVGRNLKELSTIIS